MVSKEQILEQSRLALVNTINQPQIATTLAAYGYDSARLQRGLELCDEAQLSLQIQGDAFSNRIATSKNFQELFQEGQLHASHDFQIARLALKGNAAGNSLLHAIANQAQSYARWHIQANEFYSRLIASAELQEILNSWGVSAERIQRGMQFVQEVESARLRKQVERSSATLMRRQRNETFVALQRWMFTFRKVARLALRSKPELLNTLGIKPVTPRSLKKESAIRIEIPSLQTTHYLNLTPHIAENSTL